MTAVRHLAYLLPVAGYGLVLAWSPPDVALLADDSRSYLRMAPHRTLGYPLFLASLRAAGLPVESVPSAQVVVFCLALAFLGWATARTTGRAGWAALLVVAIAANPFLAEYHFVVVTESLFMALQLLIVALLALYLHRPSRSSLALAGLVIGLAVTVRPVGYAFVPLLPLAALLAPRGPLRARAAELAIALVAALAVVALESAAYHAHFGSERRSITPLHLFAKAGLIDGAPAANPYPPQDARHDIWQALRPELEEMRERIREAPTFGASSHLLATYEGYLQRRYARDRLERAASALGVPTHGVQLEISRAILADAPGAYLALTAREFARMWTVFSATHPRDAAVLVDYLDDHRPLPLDGAGGRLDEAIPARPMARVLQPALRLAGALGALIVLVALARAAWRRRPGPALATATLVALMVNGNFLLVALTATAGQRYTLAMWPGIVAYGVYGCVALAARLSTRDAPAAQKRRGPPLAPLP